MSQVSKLLEDGIVKLAKQELEKLGKTGLVARKLQAIISAKEFGITHVSNVFCITRVTLTSWIKLLKRGSSLDLEPKPKRPKKSLLSPAQLMIMKGWIDEDSSITINQVRIRIEEEMGVKISKSGIHKIIKKLEFSYITPRPSHHKKDHDLAKEFKKKSNKRVKL
jgi:transposase